MTIKDEILTIANQLADKGLTPTVATVKAKLSSSAPLPTIINTLKHWQHQPIKEGENVKQAPKVSESDEENELVKALQPLLNELIEIKSLLKSIDSKLD